MKKGLKNVILSVCGVLMTVSVSAASLDLSNFTLAENATALSVTQNPVWSTLDLADGYAYGSTFTIPKRTVTVGGKQVNAKAVLQYPNGATTVKESVTLSAYGYYQLAYTAVVNGKAYLDERTFFVNGAAFSVGNAKSSITYGAYEYAVDREALVDGNGKPVYNADVFQTERKQYTHFCEEGVMVRLARGDTLQFHEIIDLSNVSQFDSLVKAFPTPDEQGIPDFEKLTFTFTDVYDPSITLSFVARHDKEGYEYRRTYSLVAGNGQKLTGKDSNINGDRPNTIYVGDGGTSGDGTFTRRFKSIFQNANGVWVDEYREQDAIPIDFRFDSETKTAYLRDYRNATRINTIADLDDPEYFDALWSGFTDGKVRLSVTADVYSAETANFCISHVYGLDLTKAEYADTVAPTVTVDCDYDNMPTAEVGGKYPVPTATAFDLDAGKLPVKTTVWYNYTSSNATLLAVKDGWFSTDKFGDYAIVYEATDGGGNVAKEILWVRAEQQLPPLQLVLDTRRVTEAVCGTWIVPADYTVENATCAENDVVVSIKATFDGEEIAITEGFRPERAGTYQIVYTATDYIGRSVENAYTLQVEKGERPLFVDEPMLPFTFVSGKTYVMPTVYVNDYTGANLQRSLAYAEVTDKNGTNRVECGQTFVPTVEKQGDEVTVVYKYKFEGETIESKPYTVPAILPKGEVDGSTYVLFSNYLLGEGFTASQPKTNRVVVEATQSNGAWTYAQELLADAFSVKLSGVETESLFEALRITLIDSQNEEEQIAVEVQNLLDSMIFVVGAETVEVGNSFQRGDGFTISYADGILSVGSARITLKSYVSGKAFAGFSSEKVLLNVAFVGAETGAKYTLDEICGQTVNRKNSDRTNPIVVVNGDYGGLKTFGERITLPAAKAFDVLDPNVQFSVTVTKPNGEVLTDVYGYVLQDVDPMVEYTIALDAYGTYMVTYTATDTVGNDPEFWYSVIVKDEIPPTLTFTGKSETQAKVGDTLVLPSFQVEDNVSASESLVVSKFVYTPSGRLYALKNGNAIVCSQTGVYEFRVTVTDEEGNVAIYTYTVKVTA